MRETKIKSEISERIIHKIKNENAPPEVQRFLIDAILIELDHIDEIRPRVLDDYKRLIEKYAKNFGGE